MRWLIECQNAIQWGNSLRLELFKSKYLNYLALLAVMATLAVGLLLFVVDSNIKSPLDGIWSAWVTMTHVGFGDIVPISFLGRLLASGLILFGLILFSLFTALASVTLLGKNIEAFGGHIPWTGQHATNHPSQETQILAELNRLHERMTVLEQQLSSSRPLK